MSAPVIAVVGGGQLARMMAPAAGELGVHLRVLVEAPGSSAAQVVTDAPVGAATDEAAIRDLIAPADGRARADVLTFEHEHVPNDLLTDLIAHGTPVRPAPHALVQAQDKIVMRRRLTELGAPCPRWAPLPVDPEQGHATLAAFLAEVGGQAVVKTSRGGYDGKGVRIVSSADEAADWLAAAAAGGPQLLVEEKVPFTRELAVLVARRPSGEVRTWPVVESIQRDGVCSEVIAPAPDLTDEEADAARTAAVAIAEGLDVTGVLAVEMFEVVDGAAGAAGADGRPARRVLVNELAMRPHNSGHWTIDGSVTSQFEQHLRAVLDLPLGDTSPTAPWTVMANVLGSSLPALTDALPDVLGTFPDARVNLYGKDVRPGRKLAHVNVSGQDLDEVRRRALGAAALLRGEALPENPTTTETKA
ncbi:5-(carboxyamino)imidazole ribonucleotide synthase [Oerskovia jenensis]|uniref:N5-carboxyaminoimidazole ribonucleotide synthase n=1 Tax=Oerskovia jenensis TaxID=162169 RepID=A0ABS2LIV7_9CELL|nr:5-(carboxyamino)imidazole ribonucleotide synthase [Oerskovia jenensis]MBM7480353.1 5-(carboxyamino)imidazole ribonucleotide synthase [Oerskovia jenensis]